MQRSRNRGSIYKLRKKFRAIFLFRGREKKTASGHRKGRKKRHILWQRFIPFLFFAAIGLVSLSLLVNYGVNSIRRRQENNRLSQEYSEAFMRGGETTAAPAPEKQPEITAEPEPMLRETYRSMGGGTIPEIRRLYEQNNDLVGWLYIKGVVDLPVVYRDNEYYLNHNFRKKREAGGTLFLDENHPLTEKTQNLVIHGHNMYDSSMFGILASYEQLAVVKNHAFASFSTLYAPEEYVVFAVLRVEPDKNSEKYFNYVGRSVFQSEEDFYGYTGELQKRSLFSIPVDVLPSDSLLTLATCVDDDRLAVVFRRLRAEETKEELQQLVNEARRQ